MSTPLERNENLVNLLAGNSGLGTRVFMPPSHSSDFPVPRPGFNGATAMLADKRNRNPNWTDGEIMRFLEILQERDTLRDLCAQRNKQVFCYVAQRLCSEGAEKTWDQCRIKLKNLKSQYRYVKERIPEISQMDIEDEEVMKKLVSVCQSKGISTSSLKHLRYLRRFLSKMSSMRSDFPRISNSDQGSFTEREEEESVSPPSSPIVNVKILSNDDPDLENFEEPPSKKRCMEVNDGHKFIEKFNQDMMEQFLEHQRKVQASFQRWELEKQKQHEEAMEKWRSEARQHEKAMFGMFVQVMSECNNALTNMLKVNEKKSADSDA